MQHATGLVPTRRTIESRGPSRRARRRARGASRLSASALLLSLALTACGSTLEESGTDALAGGGTDQGLNSVGGGGVGGADVDGTTGGGLGPAGGGTGGSGGGTTGVDGGLGSASGGGSTGSGSTGAGSFSGTTGAPGAANTRRIKLGLIVIDSTKLAAGFGAAGSDATKPTDDFVKYLNKTGGFAGRQIDPVYYKVDGTGDGSTISQEACEQFKDEKVELVITPGSIDVLAACLGRAGIMIIDTTNLALDGVEVARFRNRLFPNAMRMDRLYPASMRVAAQRGVLKKGDVIGILREDCIAQQRIMKDTMRPLADELGVKVVEGTHSCVTNLADGIASISRDVQREVVRFRQEGVTHVMLMTGAEAFALYRFTETASQQQWFPKYVVTSIAYPYTNTRPGSNIKIEERARPNVYGVGYQQMFDVGDNDAVPAFQAKERARCKAADPSQLGATGDTTKENYVKRQRFWQSCDGFFTARALLEATRGDTSIAAMTRAYTAVLGRGKKVSASLAGGYHEVTSTRVDGAGFVRPFVWNASKNTYLYAGAAIAVP